MRIKLTQSCKIVRTDISKSIPDFHGCAPFAVVCAAYAVSCEAYAACGNKVNH